MDFLLGFRFFVLTATVLRDFMDAALMRLLIYEHNEPANNFL